MSNYFGYVSVDALMDFAHNHVNGMIDSNDIARFPKANVKDANEQQSLQEIFGIPFARLRELAEAEREGKIRIGSVWTPCAEGLPTKEQAMDGKSYRHFHVTITDSTGKRDDAVEDCAWRNGEWYMFEYDCNLSKTEWVAVAWKAYPAPYRADQKED